jgi:hypothetical protein
LRTTILTIASGKVGFMGDPELRSDENILLRTPGVFVKSIAFEGYLTNKRIILIDRVKKLLPQKEISLVTIKDIEPGENAIRDQIITLSILAKSGETRQMILTFSRQTGGNRIRERNEWVRLLKENASSSIIDQVIRKVIPGTGPVVKKPAPAVPPRLEVISSPGTKKVPPAAKPPTKKVVEPVPPVKKVIEFRPDTAPPLAAKEVSSSPAPGFGTYCSRCGNRVPEGSGFCNRCGSQIVVPGSSTATSPPTATVAQPADSATMAGRIAPVGTDIQTTTRIEYPIVAEPSSLSPEITGEYLKETWTPPDPETVVPHERTTLPTPEGTTPESDEKPGPATTGSSPPQSASVAPSGVPPSPQKPSGGFRGKLSKKAVIGIVLAIIIVAVVLGGFFLYPKISKGGEKTPDNTIAPATSAGTVQTTPKSSTTFIAPRETTVRPVPTDGVYVHINYIGGWKGSYGIPSALQTVTKSGDIFYRVENATGTVQATFEKLDGSTRQVLLVEIFRNGSLLTSGNTSAGFGKITLSVDTTTGIAAIPNITTSSLSGMGTSNTTPTPSQTTNSTAITTTTTVSNTTTGKP